MIGDRLVRLNSVTGQTGVIMGLLVKITSKQEDVLQAPPGSSSHWSGGRRDVDSRLSRDFSLRTEAGLV